MRTLVLTALLLGAAAAAGDADRKSKPHPHFNDGGTLEWYTKLAEAQAAAKKAGKLVFIEYGREL